MGSGVPRWHIIPNRGALGERPGERCGERSPLVSARDRQACGWPAGVVNNARACYAFIRMSVIVRQPLPSGLLWQSIVVLHRAQPVSAR
jgi:hypothetical protein